MTKPDVICQNEQRRHRVRQENYNGLDFLELIDKKTLKVHFLGKSPKGLTQKNIRITGGQRIRDIGVDAFRLCARKEQYLDDCMIITVDKEGDFSTYTLCVVKVEDGRQTDEPFPGFDPRYACLDFNFRMDCPSDLDCKKPPICPPQVYPEPEINYLAKDYASFRQLILDRLALIMPDWQERHVPDLGIALVELLAYTGDHLSYYQDAVGTEAYLDTARQRISVRRHARLIDYYMHEGCNARAWVHIATEEGGKLEPDKISFITGYNERLQVSDRVLTWEDDLREVSASQYEVFEPLVEKPEEPIQLYKAHSEIEFYTWGDKECCLPRGATTASLKDGTGRLEPAKPGPDTEQAPVQQAPPDKESASTWIYRRELHLRPGDVLIFEEIVGPKTNNEADADPNHRYAVRLTKVEEAIDELYHQPVLEIAWAESDALPFPLCISVIGPPPECKLIENISVARGNIILVDHGRRIKDEALGCVPLKMTAIECKREGRPSDPIKVPGRFSPPPLKKAPLTFSQSLSSDLPAASMLNQDPRQAVPWLKLTSVLDPECDTDKPKKDAGDSPESDADDDETPAVAQEQPSSVIQARATDAPSETNPAPSALSPQTNSEGDLSEANPDQSEPSTQTDTAEADPVPVTIWTAQRDLLASKGRDPHFVVEIDNFGRTHLRFGDGEMGQIPEAGTKFLAMYRMGNGLVGNVGAEAISHIVSDELLSGVDFKPRNLLPAQGGAGPEPLAEVKLFAPHTFRRQLKRAISAGDYAEIVMRDFKDKVQRAAAVLRWTGSWYEALVTIDPRGQVEADPALLAKIRKRLYRYRRIGHDVVVKPAQYVSLDIELTVCVLPDYLRGHVKAALLARFSNRTLPDGQRGFFHPDNLTFGEGIYLSKLVAAAQALSGVESVSVKKLERLFEGPNDEIKKGVLPLSPLEIARVDNDPNYPENGQFKLIVRGGR